MKKLVLILALFAVSPIYGTTPIKAVLFHKHTEGDKAQKRYYLSSVIEGSNGQESATIRVPGNIYAGAKEGDTLLVDYNRLFATHKLITIKPLQTIVGDHEYVMPTPALSDVTIKDSDTVVIEEQKPKAIVPKIPANFRQKN